MPYTETLWSTGDIITATLLNNLESQYRAIQKAMPLAFLGGSYEAFTVGSSYYSGADYDKLVPGSRVWRADPNDAQSGTVKLEVMMRVNTAGVQGTVMLVNLASPDTALAGSTVSGTTGNTTGERIISGAITLPAAGSIYDFGIKVKTNSSTGRVSVWGAQIVRTA